MHSIALTGGEPMTNPDRLNDILNLIWNIDKKIQVQISTNGLNLREIAGFDDPNNLESIHISRHHYDDSKNIEIFGTNTIATTEDIMKLAFVGESKAREMTKEITDIISKQNKKLPRGLFPMQVVQEYLGININYLKKIERG